jgi:hypothetical protein
VERLFQNRNFHFASVVLTVVLCFVCIRPLKSPWHPFIAGDGLGYYSYLPAKFIHNDPQLDFKWFNRVHNTNYIYSAFDNPEDNLLVAYGDKRINKYYQGLSFLWMPFFIAGHLAAKVLHYTPDGFSPPYQATMALASVFYLLLGLFFLHRLLLAMGHRLWIASLTVLLVFSGTYLFNYALFANTLSHSYSFTFVTGFFYYSFLFFHRTDKKLQFFLMALFCLVISFCIRPLTVLSILALPAFYKKGCSLTSIVKGTLAEKFRWMHLLLVLLSVAALSWQFSLNYIQTGSLFSYTYTDEKFNFSDARFGDALLSYHMGLFVYVPLFFFAMLGFSFIREKRQWLLPVLFFGLLFVYSAWWYWPITKRAMIDFYAIPAIGLASFLSVLKRRTSRQKISIALLLLCVGYFQLKALQIRDGILDEYLTHKDLFWSHFARLQKAHIYPVPPQSILEQENHLQDFEDSLTNCKTSSAYFVSGHQALELNKENYICRVAGYDFPKLFIKPGVRKIRISMDMHASPGLKQVHLFLKFLGQNDRELLLIPFYIGEEYIQTNQWEHKEFGYDLTDRLLLNNDSVKRTELLIWNVEPEHPVFIDQVRTDFIMTNSYFETLK